MLAKAVCRLLPLSPQPPSAIAAFACAVLGAHLSRLANVRFPPMSVALLLASLAVTQAVSVPPPPPAGAAEINALARKVRSFKPKDQFDGPLAQQSVASRTFMVEISPRGSNTPPIACFGYPMWSYDSETGTLYVSTGGHELAVGSFSSRQGQMTPQPVQGGAMARIQYFASDCDRADLKPYTASNSYGASYDIKPTLQTITAIADSLPRGKEWPSSFRITVSGDQARSLVPNLRVRFHGRLHDWKPGVAVACLDRRTGPTASSPYDRRFDICLFNGQLDRIELLDARTGKLIESFVRPT